MTHDRWFSVSDGLFFVRQKDGAVRIVKTDGKLPEDGGHISFDAQIDDGSWASAVLTMSEFNERPGDWYVWMDHHHGRRDAIKTNLFHETIAAVKEICEAMEEEIKTIRATNPKYGAPELVPFCDMLKYLVESKIRGQP